MKILTPFLPSNLFILIIVFLLPNLKTSYAKSDFNLNLKVEIEHKNRYVSTKDKLDKVNETNCSNESSYYTTSTTNTLNNNKATNAACITPSATSIPIVAVTGQNAADFWWVPGNPTGSPTLVYFWVIGTSPLVTYGNGVTQGTTYGNFMSTTDLLPGVTYYLRVYANTTCNNTNSDYSTSLPFTTISCNTPGTPTNIIPTVTGPTSVTLNWAAGNPGGSATVTYYWVVGTSNSVTYGNGVAQGSTNGTSTGVTGLISGTTYYFRIYAKTSCDNSNSAYGTSYSFSTNCDCQTPGTPENLTTTSTTPNAAGLDWTAGSPVGTPTITYYWVVGTSPTVTYGNGVSQGSTTETWASTLGLAPGITYYLRVYASSNCNNSNSSYSISYAFMTYNAGGCTTPGTPLNITGTPTGPNSASLDWSSGNPLGSASVTYYWVVGTNPNVTYNNGISQGSTNETWAGANGLSPGTTYYLRVYASTNCNNSISAYGTSNPFTTSGNNGCVTPGTPVNAIATATGPTTASLDWASGNPVGSPTITYYWVVGTNASVTYGNGVAQGNTSGLWAGATGLAPCTNYYLRVFASSSCNNSISEYVTSYVFTTNGSTTCVTPGTPVYVSAVATGQTTASLDWASGNPAGSPNVTYYWVVGTSPSVTYGNGVTQGSTNGFWAGATGLSPNTTYYLRVYASSSCNNSISAYGTSSAFTTGGYCVTPGTPVYVSAVATGQTTASLDWASGNPVGSPNVTYYWVVGTSPSVTYGNGVTQGTTNGFWAGATGLSPNTTYYLRVYAKTSCNNSISAYGTSYAFTTDGYHNCVTPGTPVYVSAVATGQTTASLDWASGNPAGSPDVSYYWVVGTSPTVTYGNGVTQGSTNGFWAGATGLSPGTTYYLRVYAKTSCNNSISAYGTSYAFTTDGYHNCVTPGTPVYVSAVATGQTTASLDWASGNPVGSLNVTYYWVVGTSPSVTYGNGVTQGSTIGFWAGATGLSPNTTYYLRVYAKTSCNNSVSAYGTSSAFTTGGYCVTPGTPVYVSAVATGQTTASLDWASGNPAGSPDVSYYWVVGTSPTVTYGNGVTQGSTIGFWAGATGLSPNTTYYLRVYAKTSCNNSSSAYGTSSAFTTGGYCVTPGTPVYVSAVATGQTTASLDWASGNPAGSPNVTYYWVVGTSPSVTYGNGVTQGSTNGFWAGAIGLSPGTTYYLRVYAKTSCNNSISAYGTSYAFTTDGYHNCVTPGTPVYVSAVATGQTTASLDWASGNPAGSPDVSYYWVVGTSPTVTYGNGVTQGSTNGFWAGETGLSPNTTYYLRVYASSSCNNSISAYGTSSAFTTGGYCVTPGTPVYVSAVATGQTTASLDWASGNPVGSLNVTYYWVVGTSPSVTYGNGVTQGSTNGFWAGATGLTPNTTYYLRVYAKTSCNNSISAYGTSYPFTTGGYCVTPGTPVYVSAVATGQTTASLDWASGNPAGSPDVTYYWVVGNSPSVTYGNGVTQGSTNGFWAGATGLSPNTTYYLRVYAKTSCNNSISAYGTSYPFTTGGYCITPGTPVYVSAVATGQTTASLDWASGNPAGSPDVTYYWVVGTSPSVTYGNGVTQGSSSGFWAGAIGLSPNTTYYLRVYAKTSCNNSISAYGTSYPFTTGGYCITPGTPVYVSAVATGQTTASLDWASGNPAGSPDITYYWVVGNSPSVTYGNGVTQGSTNGFWAGATGLSPNTTYYLRVYAKTSCNNSISAYGTSFPFTTGGYCVTPGTPVYVSAVATGQTTASLDWASGNPAGSPNVTYYWVVGTSPSVTYGNGVTQGSTNGFWAGATGLSPNTTYYLRVYGKTSCNNSISAYGTSYPFTTGGYCVTPGTPVYVSAVATGQTTASLDWASGNPAGSPDVTYYWVVGSSPSVTYGNGVTQGSTNGFWAGATGLSPGTTYYLRVYAKTSCNNSISAYGTSSAFTTSYGGCSIPVLQSYAISFSQVGTQQFNVNWTNGNGSRRVVKINTINSFTPPINGTDPLANSNIIGYGEQVVYNGSGNSVTITGLFPGTTYWIRIYEANCVGNNSVYNTTVGSNNPNSQRTLTVLPSVQSFEASNVILDNGNIVEINSIFFTKKPYDTHQPIDVYVEGNNKTRFTLNASNAADFSFQLVDQLTIVTDETMALDPEVYGKLGPVTTTSFNSMYMDYTHPDLENGDPTLSLKIKLLYEGGLVGMSIPVHVHPSQIPLPVEIIDLQAKYDKKMDVNELLWTTNSEVNNDYFEIERSFEKSAFENIGKVFSAGNSSYPKEYFFSDNNIPHDGNYIYRLKQVDLDGRSHTSELVSVLVSRASTVKTGIFPNPASDLINFYAEAYEGANVNIEFFNSLGQKVSQYVESETMANKILEKQMNTNDIGKGTFTVVFTIDGIRYNHKLIILE